MGCNVYRTNINGVSPHDILYFRYIRREIAEYVREGSNRILDVGCGAGYFGEYLKLTGRAAEVIGIEIDALAAGEASSKLDRVLCADLNHASIAEILKDFNKASFDYIVCADVLEHLIDPWKALSDLVRFLRPGGMLVVSLPNVRHWQVWLPLIARGRWKYREAGIMDITHLRFFTRDTSRDLLNGAGLQVVKCLPLIGGKWKLLDKLTLGMLAGFIAIQWVIVGVKSDGNNYRSV